MDLYMKICLFHLKLNDFIVERYPGSKSPSWFESRVELKDDSRQLLENRRIFMNNILNYRGYRFYQSSYTSDEKGTDSFSKPRLGGNMGYLCRLPADGHRNDIKPD